MSVSWEEAIGLVHNSLRLRALAQRIGDARRIVESAQEEARALADVGSEAVADFLLNDAASALVESEKRTVAALDGVEGPAVPGVPSPVTRRARSRVLVTRETTFGAVVGRVIAKIRAEQSTTQAELADALGLTQGAWSRIERGESELTVDRLREAARLLSSEPHVILERAWSEINHDDARASAPPPP